MRKPLFRISHRTPKRKNTDDKRKVEPLKNRERVPPPKKRK